LNLENYFISQFKSSHIGDDAALIGDMVYSKDAFFENVHFKKEWISYYYIAKKAMLINISDAIAMNAEPEYALLAVSLPSTLNKLELKSLFSGFNRAAKEFGIEIIGGDTISNIKIDITVTVLSKSKKPLKRVGLKQKHFLAFTGELGSSKKALKSLLSFNEARKSSRFFDIKLRQEFIKRANASLSCGMDISDGLFSDLKKLSSANSLGFSFNKKLEKSLACSGEEYEMLIGFSPRHRKKLIRLAKSLRVKLNIFAIAQRKSYKSICKAHHF